MADLNLMAEKIKNILGQVHEIRESYDYEPQSMNLPAATLFFDSFNQNQATIGRAQVNWNWTVRLYIPINTSDPKIPQQQIKNLIMNAIKKLRSDISLGGSCFYHTVTNGDVFAVVDQNNPMMVAELTLVATTEEDM